MENTHLEQVRNGRLASCRQAQRALGATLRRPVRQIDRRAEKLDCVSDAKEIVAFLHDCKQNGTGAHMRLPHNINSTESVQDINDDC